MAMPYAGIIPIHIINPNIKKIKKNEYFEIFV